MKRHYDPKIKDLLGAKDPVDDVVLNRCFEPWARNIKKNLYERTLHKQYYRYNEGEDSDLLDRAVGHIYINSKRELAEDVVILAHPFYLHLSQMHHLTRYTKRHAEEYAEKMMKFLRNRPKEKLSIAAFETLHHYAAATSLLLEQGLVDQALLTEFDIIFSRQ